MVAQGVPALACWALVLCAAAVLVDGARSIDPGANAAARQLLQTNTRCPAGCTADGCVLDSTSGGYKCIKCQNALTVNANDGTCGCPAGRFASTASSGGPTCVDCDKGSYCEGGPYTGAGVPAATPCPGTSELTTIGKRSTSKKACVNVPGRFYRLDTNGNPGSTTCPVDTYGPGLRKQRACVPCPPGYTSNTKTGQTSSRACVVPEGYYLKGPGQVAPCPKGEYKSGFEALPSCTKCAPGVSTPAEASTSEAACTVVLPTFYPSNITNGIVKATELCPQKYICPGGSPTAAFSPASPNVVDSTTVQQCPLGTWTQTTGGTSLDQCMTPPGYRTTGSGTEPCANGQYRPDWKPAAQAGSCFDCGENIMSNAIDQIVQYAITTDATASPVSVRATAASCYIKPGQGMYFSAASNLYRAVNCEVNQYGATNLTYGLAAIPCRDCPTGMITSTELANSVAHWVIDDSSPPLGGFTSPMACVTKTGFGYNGRVATKCPAGSYNAAGTYGTCTKCPYGLSTTNNADGQVSLANCTLAPGFGFDNNVTQPCPVGTYNDKVRNDTTMPCDPCPAGLTSAQPGAASVSECSLCQEGWGGPGYGNTCNIQCGGANGASFGPAGRDSGQPCFDCPAQSIGFSFDYLARNQPFAPGVIARAGATAPAECLSEFAQISDIAWYMDGSAPLVNVSSATTWQTCLADCQADATCQYVTFDYDTLVDSERCFKKVAGNGSDIIGFKAVVAGDMGGASSVRNGSTNSTNKARSLASGSYSFWKDDSNGMAAYLLPIDGITTVQQCLNACDQASACVGVVMTGLTTPTSNPTSCSQMYGNSNIAVFKRGMTKAVASRLRLSDVLQ